MNHWLRRWWRQPDRFDWFALYLDDRRVQPVARIGVAVVTATFAAVAAAMLSSPAGPHGAASTADCLAAVIGAVLAVLWLFRWPTLRQSRLYVFLGDAAIASACLSQSNPITGLTGCYAFVVLGSYIALMHCAKATTYNLGVSLSVAGYLTWQVVERRGDAVLAGCELTILLLFSVGAPYAIQTMLHLMASDILRSDHDALTGLLNRRGFYRHTSRLIARHANASYLTITLIDLDHFKLVNDNYGHLAGDKALVDVGHALRVNSSAGAVIAALAEKNF